MTNSIANVEKMEANVNSFQRTHEGNLSDFTYVSTLSKGTFAEAQLFDVKRPVVVKKLSLDNKTFADPSRVLKIAEAEAKLLVTLSHPNIVKIYHAWLDSRRIYLEMEFCKGGSLQKLIDQYRNLKHRFKPTEIKRWLTQMAVGLAYLHDLKFVHRDLKCENILMSADFQTVKIGGFGASKLYDRSIATVMALDIATVNHLAPEMFLGLPSQKNSPKVDIWALGVIAYEMVFLEPPYNILQINELLKLYQNIELKPEGIDKIDKLVSPYLRLLIEHKLLVVDSQKRADIDQVLTDVYLADEAKRLQYEQDNYLHEQVKKLKAENPSKQLIEEKQARIQHLKETVHQLQNEINNQQMNFVKASENADRTIHDLQNNLREAEAAEIKPSFEGIREQDLFYAAERGDIDTLRSILSTASLHINVDSRDTSGPGAGKTPLMWAAQCGHCNVCLALLSEFGADVGVKAHQGWTALMYAAYFNNADVAQMLLDFDAQISDENNRGENALSIARDRKNTETVELLRRAALNSRK